jgi:hypothetical protein
MGAALYSDNGFQLQNIVFLNPYGRRDKKY